MNNEVVDFTRLTPIESVEGEDQDETELLQKLYREAEKFISSFRWCKKVVHAYMGYGVGEVIGIFFFEIEPASASIDKNLWVLVGDLPPAYIVTDQAKTPAAALVVYIKLFREWASAVESGRSTEHLIPANAPPTDGNAKSLLKRLSFLENVILPEI